MDLKGVRNRIRGRNVAAGVLLAAVWGAIVWYVFEEGGTRLTSDDVKNVLEAGAIMGAGAYFIYRAYSGFFIINLTLRAQCTRVPRDEETDYLVVDVHLEKGDRGTLVIHDAQVRVVTEGGSSKVIPLPSVQRLSLRHGTVAPTPGDSVPPPSRPHETVEIRWRFRSVSTPFLQMTPGEQASFACYDVVPRREACTVDVVVLGKHATYDAVGQWRAACVSPPAVRAPAPVEAPAAVPSRPAGARTAPAPGLVRRIVGYLAR